jgi:hypothetical protein
MTDWSIDSIRFDRIIDVTRRRRRRAAPAKDFYDLTRSSPTGDERRLEGTEEDVEDN